MGMLGSDLGCSVGDGTYPQLSLVPQVPAEADADELSSLKGIFTKPREKGLPSGDDIYLTLIFYTHLLSQKEWTILITISNVNHEICQGLLCINKYKIRHFPIYMLLLGKVDIQKC